MKEAIVPRLYRHFEQPDSEGGSMGLVVIQRALPASDLERSSTL